MSDFTVALADVRRVTGLGYHATRSILNKPKLLPFQKAKPGTYGGNSERLFSLRHVLLRLRQKHWFTQSMEQQLCRINFAARMNEVNSQ